jgi:subtilisin family serine protease
MSQPASFTAPTNGQADETTGKFVITFRDSGTSAGLASLKKRTSVKRIMSAADFKDSAINAAQMEEKAATVFPTLGIAVATLDEEGVNALANEAAENSPILAIEPERIFYALDEELSISYLRGYKDAISHLYEKISTGQLEEFKVEALFQDDAQSTWGLKATGVTSSKFTGKGIRVAVLDTGMDSKHPDFVGRSIKSKSFISGEPVQDGNSHGTHCIGTACGSKDMNGRRYGVAREAIIYVGKVLSNAGSGATSGILAGMEWAVVNKCSVISMSLGNMVTTPSTAYETAGQRALQNRCLIVAAAGNHGAPPPPDTVGQPANSSSIMAVGAVDNQLRLAPFSCTSGPGAGAKVDIVAPGVAVYSSVPMPARYGTFSGTSMATPHVAGIAALWSQATGAKGFQLWQKLISQAKPLPLPVADVGSGIVQAPQ